MNKKKVAIITIVDIDNNYYDYEKLCQKHLVDVVTEWEELTGPEIDDLRKAVRAVNSQVRHKDGRWYRDYLIILPEPKVKIAETIAEYKLYSERVERERKEREEKEAREKEARKAKRDYKALQEKQKQIEKLRQELETLTKEKGKP